MDGEDVRARLEGNVGEVEIARGPNNFFDAGLIGRIADALDDLATGDCRAVVLCSEGRHFCAGANFGGPPAAAVGEGGIPHLYDQAIRLFEQPLPIVAAVQGAAIGGGLGLALAADFRVAAPEARFSANFARLGFHHGFGLSVTLPLVVGHQAALDLLYTGRRIPAEAALAIGLCDAVVPWEELRAAASARAAEIASSAPLAVRSIRATMRGPLVEQVRAALARERAEQDRLQATADFREGIAATAERREPDFRGR
jgi:enoyl-CoA hydratase/carnithine racemase